uniref:Attacin 2 n=1 Tax=Lasioderma serricorne TaxID=295660 RepID=A0A8F9S3V3_9COLE|nr:attacin 2 [Lasioderma serricorne]
MLKIFVIAFCVSCAFGYPYEIIEDDQGLQYIVVPSRVRRDLDISKSGSGTRVTAGHGGTIFKNDRHQLDGSAYASQNFKHFKPAGPLTTGGELQYQHLPSGSSASLGATNTRGYGTDLSAQGNLNLYRSQDGRTTLDAYGNYDRHYRGPWGTGRPNYGGGLNLNHRF